MCGHKSNISKQNLISYRFWAVVDLAICFSHAVYFSLVFALSCCWWLVVVYLFACACPCGRRSGDQPVCYSQVPAWGHPVLPQGQHHQRGGVGAAARVPQWRASLALSLTSACRHALPALAALPPAAPSRPGWVHSTV